MAKYGGTCKFCGKKYKCRRRDFLCCQEAIDSIEAGLSSAESRSENSGTSAVPRGVADRIGDGFWIMSMSDDSIDRD